MRKVNQVLKVRVVKNEKMKTEYAKQNMAVFKKSLNLLKKEELQGKIYSPISQEFEDS